MTWNVRVETSDGTVKEFKTLSCYEITEEQKAKWVKLGGEEEKVTVRRIKAVSEWQDDFFKSRR